MKLYISKVKVENFRNLENFEINLNEGLNVILGENNVGKTNFVSALRMALNYFFDPIEPINLSKEDIYISKSGEQDFSKPIKIILDFNGIDSIPLEAEFQSILADDISISPRTARLAFIWSWNENTQRYTRGWYGGIGNNTIDSDIFQSLPVTYLGALRDALKQVIPGKKNYLSDLFDLKAKKNQEDKKELVNKINESNKEISSSKLVKEIESDLNNNIKKVCGEKAFKQEAYIETYETDFDQIIKNLRVNLKGNVTELSSNGLGYNNLICISIIIAKLCMQLIDEEIIKVPFLIIEEPEAHLHPQLQSLLAHTLDNNCSDDKKVQTIVTSHSAVLAQNVEPESIHIMHNIDSVIKCFSLIDLQKVFKEKKLSWGKFKRFVDITKATMFFARGIIFVEGITEAMLISKLAEEMNCNLKEHGISIIPCGVEFNEVAELYTSNGMSIPVAIITDSDPETIKDLNGKIIDIKNNDKCARVTNLIENYDNKNQLKIFTSSVTLEYDLAQTNKDNLGMILSAWKKVHPQKGKALEEKIEKESNEHEKIKMVWLDICTSSQNSKCEFMEKLIESLDDDKTMIKCPLYIENAIKHVIGDDGKKQLS